MPYVELGPFDMLASLTPSTSMSVLICLAGTGSLSYLFFVPDQLHLSQAGYQIMLI
jgi:hypothetical protein